MAFDITGKLYNKQDTKQVSERFSKREFVLEVADGKYPQFILFQSTGDRIEALNALNVGDEVRVTFNIRGREWKSPKGETKFFVSLDVWKVDLVSAQNPVTAPARGGAHDAPTPAPTDDIPFLSCDIAREPSPIARVIR